MIGMMLGFRYEKKLITVGGVEMNLVFLIVIIFSLLASTLISVLTLKKRNNKWLSLLSAFCINIIILVIATWSLYRLEDEARLFGFGQTRLYLLIFSIPLITYINFFILGFLKYRENQKIKRGN